MRIRRDIHGSILPLRLQWRFWKMERRRRKIVGNMPTDISEYIKRFDS